MKIKIEEAVKPSTMTDLKRAIWNKTVRKVSIRVEEASANSRVSKFDLC